MTDITANEYRTAAKVDRFHGGQSAAQFYEDNARALEAVETEDITTQLAKAMLNQLVGNPETYDLASEARRKEWRNIAVVGLSTVNRAGRLIPAGGMALTAEQVEDVKIVLGQLERGGPAFEAAHERLRALFPATEPAGPCSRGVCSANNGHEGTCAEASGWAEPAEERRSFPTIQDVPNNTLFHTHGGNGSSLFVRNQSGDLRLCLNAGPEWSKLLRDEDFLPSSGPYVEVPWSKFPQPPADPFAQPAPAEPAEEETKAEAESDLDMHPDAVYGREYVEQAKVRRIARAVKECDTPASSPVVPAPTETGPWQRIEGVPVGVTRIEDAEGDLWVKDADGQWHQGRSSLSPDSFAPFVAAKEG